MLIPVPVTPKKIFLCEILFMQVEKHDSFFTECMEQRLRDAACVVVMNSSGWIGRRDHNRKLDLLLKTEITQSQ